MARHCRFKPGQKRKFLLKEGSFSARESSRVREQEFVELSRNDAGPKEHQMAELLFVGWIATVVTAVVAVVYTTLTGKPVGKVIPPWTLLMLVLLSFGHVTGHVVKEEGYTIETLPAVGTIVLAMVIPMAYFFSVAAKKLMKK